MRIPKDVQKYPPCRQCCCVLWRKSLFRVHPIGDTMVFDAIWLPRFQYHNQTYHAFIQMHSVFTYTLQWNCFLLIKRRMRRTTRRLGIRKPLWVYKNATSLDELHARNVPFMVKFCFWGNVAQVWCQFSNNFHGPQSFKIWQITVSSLSLHSQKELQTYKNFLLSWLKVCSPAVSSTVHPSNFRVLDLRRLGSPRCVIEVAFKSV